MKIVSHFYDLCGSAGIRNCGTFATRAAIRQTRHIFTAKGATIWQKVPQSGKRRHNLAKDATIWQKAPQSGKRRHNLAKGVTIWQKVPQSGKRRHNLAKGATIWQKAPQSGKRRHNLAKGATIWQKAPQSLDCGTLQDGALRRGHHSAALFPSNCSTFCGRMRCDLRHFFKCCRATFIASFLTHTVCTLDYTYPSTSRT